VAAPGASPALRGGAGSSAPPALALAGGGDVTVGRWHESRGKLVKLDEAGSLCRAFLLDAQAGARLIPPSPAGRAAPTEGALVCACGSKVGQFSLAAPLKCSCGLLLHGAAFKVQKLRVDAELQGVDGIEAALAAIELRERGGGAALGVAVDEEEGRGADGDDDPSTRRTREKRKKFAISSTGRANFTSFRNKDWN
jgi:hypothetical protein